MMDLRVTVAGSKPPLGGWLPPIQLTEVQVAVLNAAADELVPAGDGFPAPSEVDVISFIVRYVAPSDQEPKWFPFLGEDDFKTHLDRLGQEFVASTSGTKVLALQRLERDGVDFFSHLRDVVYYAYYSRPEVIRAINRNLEAGRDYRSSPQPYGYTDVMDDWDENLLSRVHGSYTCTEDVVPLPIPTDLPLNNVVSTGSGGGHRVAGHHPPQTATVGFTAAEEQEEQG